MGAADPHPLPPPPNMLPIRPLRGLTPGLLQHPRDRTALSQLQRARGFEFFASKFTDAGVERLAYAVRAGSSLRVGPEQLPALHQFLVEACGVLMVPEPELFVTQGDLQS